MAKVREDEETQKHTLHLFKGDFEQLQQLYPDLGASVIIRRLVRKKLEEMNGKMKQVNVEVDL